MSQNWVNKYNIVTCPVCGKTLLPAPMHAYKVSPNSGAPVCSYRCMMVCRRKAEAGAHKRKEEEDDG